MTAVFAKRGCLVLAFLVAMVFAPPTRADQGVQVERVISVGGIEAWLVEDHTNPIVTVDFLFEGGAVMEPEGKEGLASYMAWLLDEGAGNLDAYAFQSKLEDHAISLSFRADYDGIDGNLSSLSDERDTAFDMLRVALNEPRFDGEPMARLSGQILVRLQRDSEDPDQQVGRQFRALVYPDHPYGRPLLGTRQSLSSFTRGDLFNFALQQFTRDRLIVGVVGDITPEELAPLLDHAFGGLPAESESREVAHAELQGAGETLVIDAPVPQSTIAFVQPGLAITDPDFYIAMVVSHIMGGGAFTSRLYQEVREKRGLAYGISTYLSTRSYSESVTGQTATQNARAGETLDLIRQLWGEMAASGPSDEEVEAAKTYLTGAFALRFTNSGTIANMLVTMQLENLGIDYFQRRNSLIEAVTPAEARRVAQSLFQPDALAVVVVGQPEGITPTRPAADLDW